MGIRARADGNGIVAYVVGRISGFEKCNLCGLATHDAAVKIQFATGYKIARNLKWYAVIAL